MNDELMQQLEKGRLARQQLNSKDNEHLYVEAWQGMCETLEAHANRRFINSDEAEITPRNQAQEEGDYCKPTGLWYSCGNSWMDWCLGNDFGVRPFLHEIEMDMTDIKLISTEDELVQFIDEYGQDAGDIFEWAKDEPLLVDRFFQKNYADWERLRGECKGIEINPYLYPWRLHCLWYNGWDADAGSVWDASAIESINLLAYYDYGEKKIIEVKPL